MIVYVVLVDVGGGRVGLNLKDSTLPSRVQHLEGRIGLFGGKCEEGESAQNALGRELGEEIPGFITQDEIDRAIPIMRQVEDNGAEVVIYAVQTNLSGHRKTRATDRIGELARSCLEGDGVVRTVEWVRQQEDAAFVAPLAKVAIIGAYEACAS